MKNQNIPVEFFSEIKSIKDFCFSKKDDYMFYVTNLGDFYRTWVVPSGGGYPIKVDILQEGDVANIKLSPDGEYLALSVDKEGREEFDIYILPAEGGELRKLTDKIKLSFSDFDWSPDSRALVGIGEMNGHYNVMMITTDTRRITWLTDTPDIKSDLDWSHDGRWIAYTSYENQLQADICMVNIRTKEIKNLTDSLEGENTRPEFSPDNKCIAFTSDARGTKNVVIMELENRSTLWISQKNEAEQQFLEWHPRGDHFTFLKNENGERTIYETDYPPTKTRRISTTGFYGSVVKYSHQGDKLAVLLNSPTRPSEIFIREAKTLRILTNSSVLGLPTGRMVTPETVRYSSFDDEEISAFFYKPRESTKFPVVIKLHGGPAGQTCKGWDPLTQLLVSNGIGVFAPNVRGSSGYGSRFENEVFHDWGGKDLKDVVYAARFLKEDPFVDDKNIVVTGGSYGGYLTMMALAKYPDLWSCGINLFGPVNLKTLYGTSSTWLKVILEKKYGFKPPEEDEEFYKDRSPLNFIENINCPLLVVYGKNDPRVPINEVRQLREKMVHSKKTFEEEILQNEGHSMKRNKNELFIMKRILDFIIRNVQ
ncbi:MAG: alpha/beta fold hydrolase [Vulcanimicrobiota bacterium]